MNSSIIDYLEHWAAVHPDKYVSSFLSINGKERSAYTYADFSKYTRNLAAYLSQQVGLKHGDRVLLAYPPGLEIMVAFFACARVGVIPVPVTPPTSMHFDVDLAKLAFIAHDCQARAVLTTREFCRAYRLLLAMRQT